MDKFNIVDEKSFKNSFFMIKEMNLVIMAKKRAEVFDLAVRKKL